MATKLVSDDSRLAGKEMACHDCYLSSMEVRPRVRRKNVYTGNPWPCYEAPFPAISRALSVVPENLV